jgi:hypothetical protein
MSRSSGSNENEAQTRSSKSKGQIRSSGSKEDEAHLSQLAAKEMQAGPTVADNQTHQIKNVNFL